MTLHRDMVAGWSRNCMGEVYELSLVAARVPGHTRTTTGTGIAARALASANCKEGTDGMKLWQHVLTALMLAATLAVIPAAAAADDPLSVVETLDATVNAQNVDGALALFADDATVHQSPPQPGSTGAYQGKAAVRTFLASIVAQHIHFDLAAPRQVAGERVTWINNTSIDPWRTLGIAPLQGQGNATVQGGKIVSLAIALTPDSMAKLQAAMASAAPSGAPRTGGGGEAFFIRRLGDG